MVGHFITVKNSNLLPRLLDQKEKTRVKSDAFHPG